MKMKIVLATHNWDKCAEMMAILREMPIKIISLKECPEIGEIIEDGNSLEENALIKAKTVQKLTNLPTIADDTGLEVAVLNGEPGIYSARYAGPSSKDEENIQKLLNVMSQVPDSERTARFWCSIVYVRHAMDPTPLVIQHGWEGEILREKKGTNGFGYDPIFYVPTHRCSSAELDPAEKNKISHRGLALQELLSILLNKD